MSKTPRPMNLTEVISVVTPLLMADPNMSAASAREYLRRIRHFMSYAQASGCSTTTDLTKEITFAWLESWTLRNQPPSQNTRRLRRSTLRKLFAYLRSLNAYAGDPFLDTPEVPRKLIYVRPLTDAEMYLCQLRASTPNPESYVPTTLAIAQAGAGSLEVAKVTGKHVNLSKHTVRLLGGTNLVPRTVPLTTWGTKVLTERLTHLGSKSVPLAFRGGTDASSQTSIAIRLRSILDKAELSGKPGIQLRSIRHWAGLRMFNETGSIEAAARVLGVRSLEQAATALNYPWRTEVEL